jgi:hypothetical protein
MRDLTALAFVVMLTSIAAAQAPRTPTPAPPAQVPGAAALETDAREVRDEFERLLMRYPPEVGRILKMDPTMLTNQQYLAQYPGIQQFIAAHPEIARNPSFYLEFVRISYDYTRPVDPQSRAIDMWRNLIESASIFVVMVFVASMFAWLVKTVVTHRRWLRTSKIQTEVHNKLLERFSGTNELLTYVQSSPGRQFLEAAPIVTEGVADRPVSAPLNRILWSVQAGIVLVVGGLGFQFVSGRIMPEIAEGLWTLGVLGTAFGLGFILAGAFSFVMSRRLGLLERPASAGRERGDSTAV